ncbi:MAG: hypothetical protein P8I27_04995 [Pirellulaceae bacterium]|nr:hypothetical protein [Pirellulaceae bacterium]
MQKILFAFIGVALCGLGGAELSAQPKSHAEEFKGSQATLFETRSDIQAFSKRMDRAVDRQDLTDAIVDLSLLYLRVLGDERFPRSPTLQANRGRIAAKLRAASKKFQRMEKQADRTTLAHNSKPATGAADEAAFRAAVMDQHFHLAARAIGGTGPTMYFASGMQGTSGHFYHGRAAAGVGDLGPELLNLIQTVIHPDFWNVNGGSGRAHYYQPMRVIVVTATMRVHEDMTSLLQRLR